MQPISVLASCLLNCCSFQPRIECFSGRAGGCRDLGDSEGQDDVVETQAARAAAILPAEVIILVNFFRMIILNFQTDPVVGFRLPAVHLHLRRSLLER